MLLLVLIFLEFDPSQFGKAAKNVRFILTVLILNFILTPALSYIIGLFFFKDLTVRIALTLLLVMPCTDWYLVFTEMTGGNIDLSTAVLPYNLALQFFLLPVYLIFFYGYSNLSIDGELIIEPLIEIGIPFLISLFLRFGLGRLKIFDRVKTFYHATHENLELILICLIAFVIFATQGNGLITVLLDYPMFLFAVLLFYVIMFPLSILLAKKEKYDYPDMVSLVFTSTARNTPLSLSIAALVFTSRPLIASLLLIGPLTELPLSLAESLLLRRFKDV